MTKFPTKAGEDCGPMFAEIANVIDKHLGFFPPCFVLILTNGSQAQTLFAGNDPRDMTRLLTESASNHLHNRKN